MSMEEVAKQFKRTVCSDIQLEQEGVDRYIVHTPFAFEDGDHLHIFLKKDDEGRWVLTDEGMTYMVLSYENINLDTKTRRSIIEKAKNRYGIEDHEGEFVIVIENERYGDALFSFIQGIIHISDVNYLKTERVRSAFLDEFKELIGSIAPYERVHLDYHDPDLDPKKEYPIDCMVEGGSKPLFIFAIANDEQCMAATISLMFYEKVGKQIHSVALFENQEEIGRRHVARLSNVCEKQLSNIQAGRERLQKYAQGNVALV